MLGTLSLKYFGIGLNPKVCMLATSVDMWLACMHGGPTATCTVVVIAN